MSTTKRYKTVFSIFKRNLMTWILVVWGGWVVTFANLESFIFNDSSSGQLDGESTNSILRQINHLLPSETQHIDSKYTGRWRSKRTVGSRSSLYSECNLPDKWFGVWFEYGEQKDILINSTYMAHKGECVGHSVDKYIFRERNSNCVRCSVIHQKHFNVIQYKQSSCEKVRFYPKTYPSGLSKDVLNLCRSIAADSPLLSMFRVSVTSSSLYSGVDRGQEEEVRCPLQGQFEMTYSRGQKECSFPKSHLGQCPYDKSRLIMRFQACPDVERSESKVEHIKCVAKWKEGSTFYFLGLKLHRDHHEGHRHQPHSDSWQDRFRCFAYKSIYNGFQVSQSVDAKCDLYSPTEGDMTMELQTDQVQAETCQFPDWIAQFDSRRISSRFTVSGDGDDALRYVLHDNEASSTNGRRYDVKINETFTEVKNRLLTFTSLNQSVHYHFNVRKSTLSLTSRKPDPTASVVRGHQSSNSLRYRKQQPFGKYHLPLPDHDLAQSHSPVVVRSRMRCNKMEFDDRVGKSRIVMLVKSRCETKYVCTNLQRLSPEVLHLEVGKETYNRDEACDHQLFFHSVTRHTLLLSHPSRKSASEASLNEKECPLNGKLTFKADETQTSRPLFDHVNKKSILKLSNCFGKSNLALMNQKTHEFVDNVGFSFEGGELQNIESSTTDKHNHISNFDFKCVSEVWSPRYNDVHDNSRLTHPHNIFNSRTKPSIDKFGVENWDNSLSNRASTYPTQSTSNPPRYQERPLTFSKSLSVWVLTLDEVASSFSKPHKSRELENNNNRKQQIYVCVEIQSELKKDAEHQLDRFNEKEIETSNTHIHMIWWFNECPFHGYSSRNNLDNGDGRFHRVKYNVEEVYPMHSSDEKISFVESSREECTQALLATSNLEASNNSFLSMSSSKFSNRMLLFIVSLFSLELYGIR